MLGLKDVHALAILQTWTYIGTFKIIAFCILPVKFCKNEFIDFHENNESVKKNVFWEDCSMPLNLQWVFNPCIQFSCPLILNTGKPDDSLK